MAKATRSAFIFFVIALCVLHFCVLCVRASACVCVQACFRAYMHVDMYTYMCVYVCVCARVRACVRACSVSCCHKPRSTHRRHAAAARPALPCAFHTVTGTRPSRPKEE